MLADDACSRRAQRFDTQMTRPQPEVHAEGGDGAPASTAAGERSESAGSTALTLLGLVAFTALFRLPFQMDGLQGEPDTARLVNDAIVWEATGVRIAALSEYRYYTSPGYIWLIKELLPLARSSGLPVASYLNGINTSVAVLMVIPMYLLFRRLGGPTAALAGTLLLSLVPSYWLGGLYGFPSLPAMGFLVCAFVLFDRSLVEEETRWRALSLVGVAICLMATLLLKADFYLSAGALWGLLWFRGQLSWRNAALLCLVGGVPVAIHAAISSSLLQASPDMARYMAGFRGTYAPSSGEVWSRRHVWQLVKSMGLLTWPLFGAACLLLLRQKRYPLLATLLAWAVVPLGFWWGVHGDSTRHHSQASAPVALGVGLLLGGARLHAWGRWAALAIVMVTNYVAFAPTENTERMSGNLAASAFRMRARIAHYHAVTRAYAARPEPRTAFLGTYTTPYAQYAILTSADSIVRVWPDTSLGYRAWRIDYVRSGRPRSATMVYVLRGHALEAATAYRAAGNTVYWTQFDRMLRRSQRLSQPFPLTRF